MTIDGTVNKTAISMGILLLSAYYTYSNAIMSYIMIGFIGGFIVALITIFKKKWSPITVPIYACLEGLALGGISLIYAQNFYDGIVSQAIVLTLGILFALLFAYKSKMIKPTEIYNLGAQSHVAVSFESPEYTANSDALGTLRILEAIKLLGLVKKTKIYQASTSELYGLVQEVPQKESTPFYPRSPYAVAKLYAYWIIINYREAYNIFACNGILFNHESPIRGETFVTRKTVSYTHLRAHET